MKVTLLLPLFAAAVFAAVSHTGKTLEGSLVALVVIEETAPPASAPEAPLLAAIDGPSGIFENAEDFLPVGVTPTI